MFLLNVVIAQYSDTTQNFETFGIEVSGNRARMELLVATVFHFVRLADSNQEADGFLKFFLAFPMVYRRECVAEVGVLPPLAENDAISLTFEAGRRARHTTEEPMDFARWCLAELRKTRPAIPQHEFEDV